MCGYTGHSPVELPEDLLSSMLTCLTAAPCLATKPASKAYSSIASVLVVHEALLNYCTRPLHAGLFPCWIYFVLLLDSTAYEESSKTQNIYLDFPSLGIQDESQSWTMFSRKALHSLQKHASCRALNLKCQP